MAKVNQVLIDKLFPLAAQEHNGKMYVTPMDEHYLCNVLDGAELGRDGQVYVNRVQGMLSSTARCPTNFARHTRTALWWRRPSPR